MHQNFLSALFIFLYLVSTSLSHAQSQSYTFNYTGGVQTWTVPPCVNTIQVIVAGAKGGGINGGNGQVLNANLSVSSGQILNLFIGGMGTQGNNSGGYNGGGTGYASSDGNINYASWGGGGASDIRIGGVALTNRIIVAGGGGGRSGGSSPVCGGAASSAGNCLNGAQGCSTFGLGALGGTQSAGGAGGTPWASTPPGGSPGTLGFGGQAGYWQTASGGGGGGGYYGGGGGGNDGCCTGANGGGGGGGGSSLLPAGGTCLGASNSNHGYITINYTVGTGVSSPTNLGPFCEGYEIQLQSAPADSYSWTGPIGFVSNLQNPTIPNASINNAGLYTLTTITLGCVSTSTTSVTVNPLPIVNAGADVTVCQNTSITLTATGASSFSWDNGISNGVAFVPSVGTTTYTVTGTSLGCSSTDQIMVTVTPEVVPIFAQISPICASENIALLSTSSNSINGTWSPAVNNLATTTYTFTPTAGQCAQSTTMTVVVNQPSSPSFTQIAPICAGEIISLPNISSNGIDGSWSPAPNNLTTSTYTFTPSSGQCASTSTMTVSVDLPITPTFTQVAPVCIGTSFVLPPISNEGIVGTWSPSINTSVTSTYTFTPSAGQCANTTTMTVTVASTVTPSFTQVSPVCIGETITLNTTSMNGITGSWSPAINSSSTTTYTFTPSVGQCASTTTMTITVNQPIVPIFTSYGPYCLNDILAQVMLPSTSDNGVVGSWNPGMLSTSNAGSIQYMFTPNSGQCASTYIMNVVTNALPLINLASSVISNENCGQSDGSITGIQLSGGSGNYQVVWNNSPQLNTLDITNLTGGTYQLEVTDGNGCASQATLTVQGNPAPTIDGTSLQVVQPSCLGNGSIQGLVTSGNQPLSYSWTNTSQTTLSLTDLTPGTYVLTVTDTEGCATNFGPVTLVAPTVPTALFTWSPQAPAENSQVVFIDNSSGTIVNYSWLINGQSFSGTQVNYTVIEGNYTIQLTVTDANGCTDTYAVTLSVFDGLSIPNVLTLNNDGVNEFFVIEGLKTETTLTILNRWGEIVFSSSNYQNDWNGRDNNGLLLTEGVYTYLIREFDGTEKHGFIHLFR